MKPTILITGATSGIGRAAALLFGKHGYNLVICGRRRERLETLRDSLQGVCECALLSFDVRNKSEVFTAIESLPEKFSNIDILLNNAGNAHGLSPVHEGDLEDWEMMLDINVKGLLYVSKAVMPTMIKRKKGHIINIGSIAGKEVYARGNVYCASKFAVNALSEAMRIDLVELGIKVSEIKPGAVETEFSEVRFKGDKEKAHKTYEGFEPLTPEDIADVIYFVATRPARVNIADMLVLPLAQASASVIHRKK